MDDDVSRSRKNPDATPAPTENSNGQSPIEPEPVRGKRWRPVAIAVFVVAAAWYLILISLAALTGNPVTLNRLQLRASRLIVAGSVDEKGTVSHILVFKGVAPEGEIRVTPFLWPPGNYILPLRSNDAGELEVTPSMLPDNPPLIYPTNDKSIEQLQQILK